MDIETIGHLIVVVAVLIMVVVVGVMMQVQSDDYESLKETEKRNKDWEDEQW